MRLVVIGCEYTGKTTLIDALMEWGDQHGTHFHLDDHFSIPDRQFLSEADARAMLEVPPVIKERFQRFQIYYHVHVLQDHPDCLLGGFHIEEAVYGRRYYYPNEVFPVPYLRRVERRLPADTILLLLKASPEAVRRRMREAPHQYQIVAPQDVEAVSAEFETEYGLSWIGQKFTIDTSELRPVELFTAFRERVVPHLDTRDLLRWRATGQI